MKKRVPYIKIELREDTQINWNKEEKCLELLNSQGDVSEKHLVSIGDAYLREEKRPKVLREVENPTGGIVNIFSTEVFYDRYLAVDTSYKAFGDNYMCAAASLCVEQSIDHKRGLRKGDQITIRSLPRLLFLAKPGINPERYGWMRMIDALLRYEGFNSHWSYGVVVDSELGSLQRINAREEPIVADFFIRDNISLIYASADAGKENLLNKLIRATDGVAKKSLETALESYAGHELFKFQRDFWDLTVLNDTVPIIL